MTNSYPFEEGPYLGAAFFCEKVLWEKDDTKSAIRIVDRVIRQAVGSEPPTEMEPFEYDMVLFLRFKSGRARGPHALEVQMIKPSGESKRITRQTLMFEGEDDRGVESIGMIKFKFEETGLYWFNIFLKDIRITRIPFRIVYIPQPSG